MKPDAERPTPLEPDDPRISEWIDGRLPPAEAAAIERAVGASPALTALVTDLRAIKEAARSVAAAARPADGLTEQVMARIATASAEGSAPDPAVDAEWEAIEAERIAAERAEAAVDLAEAAREPRRHWPWLALAGALAAGLLVAVVLNLPGDGSREVALAPQVESQVIPPPNGLIESAADRPAATVEVAAADAEQALAARSLGAAKAAQAMPAAPTADPASEDEVSEIELGDAEVVAVTVRGPAGRAAFEQRVAALGLAIAGVASVEADRLSARAEVSGEAFSARQPRATRPEVLSISGTAAAIETLLAEAGRGSQGLAFGQEELRRRADSRDRRMATAAGDRAERGASEQQAAAVPLDQAKRGAAVARVLVRLIELPEPAAPQPSEPAAAEPTPQGPGAEP